MADDITFFDDIEAYAAKLSYMAGETAHLHVSTRANSYSIQVARWGAEQELVWSADELPGTFTAPPADADSRGCRWPVSVEVPIENNWKSGFYLVTLTASEGPEGRTVAYTGFVVKAPSPRNRAVMVLATNTWNAYNTWGGCSLYTGGVEVSFERPFARGFLNRPHVDRDDRKARPARWGEEPDPEGAIYLKYRMDNGYPSSFGSSGWFTFERRFVEWAENRSYEFDYAVSSDLEDPAFLAHYDVVMSVGHDEYVSAPQRRSLEAHVERGGHLVSLSGNSMFWQVRLEGEDSGVMVGHKYSAHETDPVVAAGKPELMSGMWCDPLVGQPEWRLLGAGSAFGLYHRFGQATARGAGGFTVYRYNHWLLENTGLGYGDLLGDKHGVVGYETVGCRITFDDLQQPVAMPNADMPNNVEIVAYCAASNIGVGEYPLSKSAPTDQGDLEFMALRLYGDLSEDSKARVRHGSSVMLTCQPYPNGGEVVTVGTTDWVFGLGDDAAVDQVTDNILSRFLTN